MTGVSKVVLEVDDPPKESLSGFDRLWNWLVERGDEGAIYSECYDEFPDISTRQIRYIMTDLEVKQMVTTDHSCRCGRCTVYVANPKAINRLIEESNPKSDTTNAKKIKRIAIREAKKVPHKRARTKKVPMTTTKKGTSYARKSHVPKGQGKKYKGR